MTAESIKTKLVIELQAARFLSLGFGDISDSEANVVCLSSFIDDIGQTLEYFSANQINDKSSIVVPLPKAHIKAGGSYVFDLPELDFGFRKLLLICKGKTDQPPDTIATNIRMGLSRATSQIADLGDGLQIDTTVMGVGLSHGNINSKLMFEIFIEWITSIFSKCKNVDHIRLVSNNPDTFVELFESLHKLRTSSSELISTSDIALGKYGDFSKDIATAVRLLENNPRQVIVICRTIVEAAVRKLCQKRLKRQSTKLYDDITALKANGVVPDHVFSYLQTCRVLGNFSNHSDFVPSQRDAEAVMVLTLRIVEWLIEANMI